MSQRIRLRDLEASFIKYSPYPDTWVELRDGKEIQVSGIRKAWHKLRL
jgi:hypothetical protein